MRKKRPILVLKEIYARHGIRRIGRIFKGGKECELKLISSEIVISLNMHTKEISDDRETTRGTSAHTYTETYKVLYSKGRTLKKSN